MAPLIRNIKNAMYTSTEAEVRNATSNEPSNTSIHELSNIAAKTFSPTLFPKIMNIIETRLNDKGKSWRHVLKSLQVLEYCLVHGSEATAKWCKVNIHYIRTLKQFVYSEDGLDVGLNVRNAASTLTDLVNDPELLQSERKKQGTWKSRLPSISEPSDLPSTSRSRAQSRSYRIPNEEDLQMKLAIEASLNQAKEEENKRHATSSSGEHDLAKALKLSQEEEEARRRQEQAQAQQALQQSWSVSQPAIQMPTQPTAAANNHFMMPNQTGWNQGYQQQGPVDWLGNPIDPNQQQAIATGYMGQPQQNMMPTGFLGANPSGLPMQTTGYLPMQHTFGNTGFPSMPANQAQQNLLAPAATNNPWASTAPAADAQKPQPTGSNNPFAAKPAPAPTAPSLNSLSSQNASQPFNLSVPSMAPTNPLPSLGTNQMSAGPASVQLKGNLKGNEGHMDKLNQLLSTGEGIDTFGNAGDLRVPTHHTANTYVNSAGVGRPAILQPSMTGNPFAAQTTGMGMPAGQNNGFGPQPTGHNPFGGSQANSRGGNQNSAPNLIDL